MKDLIFMLYSMKLQSLETSQKCVGDFQHCYAILIFTEIEKASLQDVLTSSSICNSSSIFPTITSIEFLLVTLTKSNMLFM